MTAPPSRTILATFVAHGSLVLAQSCYVLNEVRIRFHRAQSPPVYLLRLAKMKSVICGADETRKAFSAAWGKGDRSRWDLFSPCPPGESLSPGGVVW